MYTSSTVENLAHAKLMDGVYSFQRHFYDLTRKYYLLGRDQILNEIIDSKPRRVLEIGTGTARNLIKISSKLEGVRCVGLDASSEILKTASKNVERAKLTDKIRLERCLAEEIMDSPRIQAEEAFDAVLFSYSLSMIRNWPDAAESALGVLREGGALYVIDFYDFGGYPTIFRNMFMRWLKLFHVTPSGDQLEFLRHYSAERKYSCFDTTLFKGYAYRAKIQAIPAPIT